MDKFANAVISQAESRAKAVLDEARAFKQQKMMEAKKQAEFLIQNLKEQYDEELKTQKKIEEIKVRVELSDLKLKRQKEVFDKLKSAVMEELRKESEKLVKFALKQKGSVVRAPKSYKKYLKGFKGKFVESNIDGVEIGDGKVWYIATVDQLVDHYFEEHYPEILKKLFGE